MLHVRTEVKASGIHGLGLFSKDGIRKGRTVWSFHPKIDHTYTPNFLETVPECVADQLRQYSYVNPENPELLVVCGDDARFLNFPPLTASTHGGGVTLSTEPSNLRLGCRHNGEFTLVADRDIAIGEELTVPVESDGDATRKLSSF